MVQETFRLGAFRGAVDEVVVVEEAKEDGEVASTFLQIETWLEYKDRVLSVAVQVGTKRKNIFGH